MNWENVVEALAALAAAVVAAVAAGQSRASAKEANEAATTMATIERERRHAELCPRLRVTCESEDHRLPIRLRVTLLGPPALGRLDGLTVTIRDDNFMRKEGSQLASGPTPEDIQRQIWGPYRFTPGTGPSFDRAAHANDTGRVTPFDNELPVGEELVFQLEHTMPPSWSTGTTQDQWLTQRGRVIRLRFDARHTEFGAWTLTCEYETPADHLSLWPVAYVP